MLKTVIFTIYLSVDIWHWNDLSLLNYFYMFIQCIIQSIYNLLISLTSSSQAEKPRTCIYTWTLAPVII